VDLIEENKLLKEKIKELKKELEEFENIKSRNNFLELKLRFYKQIIKDIYFKLKGEIYEN
jgi:cell division septum initiation protein DivIVA